MILEKVWYGKSVLGWPLLPLSLLFAIVSGLRRLLYDMGLLKAQRFDVPVIVVGNITAGGTGKTPLVIWLCRHLKELGYRPAIVARGYGGKARHWPQQVRPDSDPVAVGDEAVLLARRTRCPVCVAPKRVEAVSALLEHTDCNIILSDDGLQHYALGRDVEVLVVDGERGFGNGFLLPAGPLRELPGRLRRVDLVISNGPWKKDVAQMRITEPVVVPVLKPDTAKPHPLSEAAGEEVHAIAGIGNPRRFFDLLSRHGLKVHAHAFPDHHQYRKIDLWLEPDLPVLMTEKDAVKCARYASNRHWMVRIDIEPDSSFVNQFDQLLRELNHGQEAA